MGERCSGQPWKVRRLARGWAWAHLPGSAYDVMNTFHPAFIISDSAFTLGQSRYHAGLAQPAFPHCFKRGQIQCPRLCSDELHLPLSVFLIVKRHDSLEANRALIQLRTSLQRRRFPKLRTHQSLSKKNVIVDGSG